MVGQTLGERHSESTAPSALWIVKGLPSERTKGSACNPHSIAPFHLLCDWGYLKSSKLHGRTSLFNLEYQV